jgi:hypothetical protein
MMQFRTGDGSEMISLARLACEVPDEIDDAPIFAAIRRLLDAYDQALVAAPNSRESSLPLMLATSVARSPDVPLPAFSR